jgi:hypothetical protein
MSVDTLSWRETGTAWSAWFEIRAFELLQTLEIAPPRDMIEGLTAALSIHSGPSDFGGAKLTDVTPGLG